MLFRSGEQFTCPHCGKPTEVYSRITGYYRPVQNWNDGKAQEFKERREYVIAHSNLTHQGPLEEVPAAPAAASAEKPAHIQRTILFATPTCPNCRIASQYLDKAGFQYEKLMAGEHAELAKHYGVKQAPTLVLIDGENFEKIAGAGAIKQYVSATATA